MKSILLIGLGRFGRHIAIKLHELNHQVMAVDKQEARVEAVLPYVTNGQIGDGTNEDFLRSAPTRNSWRRWASAILMSALWRSATIFKALWK